MDSPLFFGLLILLFFIFYYAIKFFQNHIQLIYHIHKLPGPPPGKNLILGSFEHLLTSSDKIFNTLRHWAQNYPPVYKVWSLHTAAVCLTRAEEFEQILSNPKHMTKSNVYNILHNWLGTGLLTSTGEKWQHRRKLLTPAYHFNILQNFVKIFNEETVSLVENIRRDPDYPCVNVTSHVTQFTLDTIAESAMGIKLDSNNKMDKNYKKALHDLGEVYVFRSVRPWLIYKFLYVLQPNYFKENKLVKILHNFTNFVISQRAKDFKTVDDDNIQGVRRKRLAMLDLLLSEKSKIDDEGIREEIDTFMFEGHDTTSAAINFGLMLIASHQDIQHRIVEEIEAEIGFHDTKPTYNDLQKLKYMEMCIKEILRLYPSVHYISRILGEDLYTKSAGYYLPKGTVTHLHVYDLHRDPNVFPDPEKFDPDRFLPENCSSRHPFAYLPFSAGQRNCIGQKFAVLEIKAVFYGILCNFVLKPISTQANVVIEPDLVLRVRNGVKVQFCQR